MKIKKDVLVFFSFRSHKKGYIEMLFARLRERAALHGLHLSRGSLKDLHIFVRNNHLQVQESLTRKRLEEFGLVYFELWYKAPQQALAAALYARRQGVPFFSEEIARIMPSTKVGEIAALADNDIPLPYTVTSSGRELKRLFKSPLSRPLQFPVVVKAADAYGGKNNHLAGSYKQLRTVLNDSKDLTFLVQAFIPNDCDYRCIVLNGEVALVLKRSRIGDTHLNNTSQGAEGEVINPTDLSAEALRDVVKAATILSRREFAGVDLIIDKLTGQHYILEVNQTPQIEIGAEVDKKMDALLSYMNMRVKQ